MPYSTSIKKLYGNNHRAENEKIEARRKSEKFKICAPQEKKTNSETFE